jgi:hypothetical protein
MHNPMYVLIWLAGLCCLWIFWDQAVKRLLLDLFRERLFELRFSMFRMGLDGKIEFESDVYRQLEILFSGLLRFGHRVTLLTFIFSREEQEKSKKNKDYVDVSQQIGLKISRLDPKVQQEIGTILIEVRKAIMLYMAFTSLFFLCVYVVLMTAKLLGFWNPDKVKEISDVVEQEAYRAESKRGISVSITAIA